MTEKEKKKEEKPKREEPKKEKVTPKKAPQKRATKPKAVKKAVVKPMVHISEFLGAASEVYDLNTMQQAGFKAYMTGKQYLTDLEAFVPYLNRYLGK